MDPDELLTSAQVAREYGYSRGGITQAARAGLLKVAFRMPTKGAPNGALLFSRADVETWQRSGRVYGGRVSR